MDTTYQKYVLGIKDCFTEIDLERISIIGNLIDDFEEITLKIKGELPLGTLVKIFVTIKSNKKIKLYASIVCPKHSIIRIFNGEENTSGNWLCYIGNAQYIALLSNYCNSTIFNYDCCICVKNR